MADKYYVLRLWDPALPGFVSGDKMYVGTEADIRKVIAAMREWEKDTESADAAERYLDGDKTATHNIAYRDIPALEPCTRVCSSTLTLGAKEWEHINTWGFPYVMRCDSAEVTQILIKYKRQYYRCLRVCFTNLRYESVSGNWDLLGDFYLGPAYMFDVTDTENEGRKMGNLLFVTEEIYKTLDEADDKMLSEEHLNFKEFCNDIFGDG